MRKTKEDTAATREAILQAALSVFSKHGYTATRLEDIALEAGVTRGAIYWHFASKADLYNTLVQEVSERIVPIIGQAVAEGGTMLERIKRIMVRLLIYAEEDEKYRATLELTVLKTEITPELEGGMQIKREAYLRSEQSLVKTIRRGIELGEIRADLDPLIGVRSMMAYMNGILELWIVSQQMFSLRADASALVDVYIAGIAARA